MQTQEKMTVRQWMSLLGLAFAVFVFNTSEFMPVSLLTDIAKDFAVSEAKAGLIISVYAWFVAIFSLPLMILASRMEMKKLLLCVLALFAAGQALSAIAPTYYMLMAARLIVAAAHSVFWSIATPMAARAVPEKYRALAISMIATGTSIAMIAGLPLGRAIGLTVGWRMTFAIVGGITLAVALFLASIFPKMPTRGTFSLGKLTVLLKDKLIMNLYLITLIVTVAYYIGYSYMEPFLLQSAGMNPAAVTITLSIYGLAGIFASLLFSKFYNNRQAAFISASLGGITLSMALLYPSTISHVTAAIMCASMGLHITMFSVAFQDQIIKNTPQETTAVAMSIYSGIYNMGIGTGTLLGGFVCTYSSIDYIGYAGAAISLAAFIYCMVVLRQVLKLKE